jgi:4-amino-4-deoxy-L-arabinose transferase-like glycosyltransferase
MTAQRHLLARPAFIFAVALILRLATAAIFLHGEAGHMTIDSAYLLTEGSEAVGIAQSLASGRGFSAPWPGAGPTALLPPVMPVILAGDMLVFGLHSRTTLVVFIVFNELCSALTIFPVFFAAKRIAGGQGAHRVAALAAWLCLLDPTAGVGACKLIWYSTISALLAALLVWATLAVRDSENPTVWTGYGLLWGTQLMTHPSFLVLLPVAILWLVWWRQRVKWSMRAALAIFTAVLCCVPWTVRNFEVFHHFVPLRSGFGLELWRRNHDGPPLHPNHDAVERDRFSSLGEYAYVHEKQREAFAWIGTHPGEFMRATAERITAFWFGHGYRPIREFLRRGEWFFTIKFLHSCALLAMVLGGLITIWRKRREYFWLLASFPAIFPLVYYITFTGNFHRVPLDPVLAVIAAFALPAWLPRQGPRPQHDGREGAGASPVATKVG